MLQNSILYLHTFNGCARHRWYQTSMKFCSVWLVWNPKDGCHTIKQFTEAFLNDYFYHASKTRFIVVFQGWNLQWKQNDDHSSVKNDLQSHWSQNKMFIWLKNFLFWIFQKVFLSKNLSYCHIFQRYID